MQLVDNNDDEVEETCKREINTTNHPDRTWRRCYMLFYYHLLLSQCTYIRYERTQTHTEKSICIPLVSVFFLFYGRYFCASTKYSEFLTFSVSPYMKVYFLFYFIILCLSPAAFVQTKKKRQVYNKTTKNRYQSRFFFFIWIAG